MISRIFRPRLRAAWAAAVAALVLLVAGSIGSASATTDTTDTSDQPAGPDTAYVAAADVVRVAPGAATAQRPALLQGGKLINYHTGECVDVYWFVLSQRYESPIDRCKGDSELDTYHYVWKVEGSAAGWQIKDDRHHLCLTENDHYSIGGGKEVRPLPCNSTNHAQLWNMFYYPHDAVGVFLTNYHTGTCLTYGKDQFGDPWPDVKRCKDDHVQLWHS